MAWISKPTGKTLVMYDPEVKEDDLHAVHCMLDFLWKHDDSNTAVVSPNFQGLGE